MIRTLLSMLNDEALQTRVMETANGLRKAYSNVMNNLNSKFEDEGDSYVMVINVPETLTSSDINVEYDDETNNVTIETKYKRGNFNYCMSLIETLPDNADVDTLAATVTNGVFTIVVDKLPEPEPEVVESKTQDDPIKVTIKRKHKK
jgi:HSP20 family molecular chaperone IbpA